MLDSKKTNNSALFRMALVAAAVILAAAVIVIGIAKAAKKPADDTSQEQSTVITESPVPSAASEPTREPTVAPAPVDFSVWKSVNDEIYGWLEIPDTNISYPVVQSATSDEYYLRRHYDGTSNTYGTIFSQGTYNNTGFTDRVTTLYGHDVWNEDLYFHQLHKFSDDTFFDEHTKVYADAGRSDLHAAHRDHLPLPAEELCQRHHRCSQVMDERTYCLTPEQWRHAKACLTLAKRWGLIGDDSPEALERRRAAKNAQAERAEQDGKPVYGTRRFSAPAYLQYELTRFKLDFAEPCEKIRALGICPDFTDAQTRAWYDANPDLFTRYAGDSFPYEEVKQIIEKRMREEVYDSLVQDLLRGPADRP